MNQKNNQLGRISPDKKEIAAKLSQSSLLLQYRVANILKQEGWDVALEYSYKDLVEMKARSADIVAKRDIGNGKDVAIGLAIECKYLFDKNLIVYKDSQGSFTKDSAGRYRTIQTKNSQLRSHLEEVGAHHYLRDDLHALQETICTNKSDKGPDIIYEAFCQATKPIIQFLTSEDEKIIWYPIVVIGGNGIYSCDLDNLISGITEKELKETKNCLFEYSFSRSPDKPPDTFIIDIIHESSFKDFLKTILKEDTALYEAFSAKKNGERSFKDGLKSYSGKAITSRLWRKI